MRALGLLTRGRRPELTADGERLATIFERSGGRRIPCLGQISVGERAPLKVLLGLDYRKHGDLPVASKRRRATFEAVKQAFEKGLDSAAILEQYAEIGHRPNDTTSTMHRAFVWELLSCGLALAFSMLLAERRKGRLARVLRHALRGRPRRPPLGAISAGDPNRSAHIVALLRDTMRLEPANLKLDPGPIRLAALLVAERDPDEFLRQLVWQHRAAKPETPWIMLVGDKVEILAPKKGEAFDVRPRTYRLDAFKQMLHDLGMIQ
jgi:hypothetical protein